MATIKESKIKEYVVTGSVHPGATLDLLLTKLPGLGTEHIVFILGGTNDIDTKAQYDIKSRLETLNLLS